MTNAADGGGGRREEVNKMIQRAADTGRVGGDKISCNASDRV